MGDVYFKYTSPIGDMAEYHVLDWTRVLSTSVQLFGQDSCVGVLSRATWPDKSNYIYIYNLFKIQIIYYFIKYIYLWKLPISEFLSLSLPLSHSGTDQLPSHSASALPAGDTPSLQLSLLGSRSLSNISLYLSLSLSLYLSLSLSLSLSTCLNSGRPASTLSSPFFLLSLSLSLCNVTFGFVFFLKNHILHHRVQDCE
jgi:hypothetical protein